MTGGQQAQHPSHKINIQLLWFDGCPNHEAARQTLRSVLRDRRLDAGFEDIEASDPVVAGSYKFAGSPTIRVNGKDIEPGFTDPGDYTPRCRLYLVDGAIQGSPPRGWLEKALEDAHA